MRTQSSAPRQSSAAADGSPSAGWRVGRAFGVPLHVQPSALAFAGVLALLYTPVVRAEFQVTGGVGFILALAVPSLLGFSVLAHELGHLLAGRLVGIRATTISLGILGGETRFDRDAPTPGREALIAAGGPIATVVMAVIGYTVQAWWAPYGFVGLLTYLLTTVNVLLAIFNLLPGLPLDGGWILRAAVWKATGRTVLSVRVAAWGGRLLAVAVAADLAVRVAQGSMYGLLLPAVYVMVAYQIWSGASAALREIARTDLEPAAPGPAR